MIVTVMKMAFKKHSPIERHYGDYLRKKLNLNITRYESIENIFIKVLKNIYH